MTDDTLSPGCLLVFTIGEYAEYSNDPPLRVVKAFSRQEIVETFRTQWAPKFIKTGESPGSQDFIDWLKEEGYVEPVGDTFSWHIGSYDELKL